MPHLRAPYGHDELCFFVPDANFLEIISPRAPQVPTDEESLIQGALAQPIGTPDLAELVSPADRVAILVDDYTRPTPTRRLLPHILSRLHGVGVWDDHITIVFALGTHRAMTRAEVEAKIGEEPAARYRVVNTSVYEHGRYVYKGLSKLGIPIWILEEVDATDVRIGLGSIVPHCDVGYAGGGKILLPGVCAAETVSGNHIKGIDFQGRNLLGASTTPIRDDIEDVVGRVGLQFVVNAITTADGRLYAAVCGDYIQAHRVGVGFARAVYGVPARRRADIAVCSAYPADVDFIQVSKSIWSGDKLTRPGGDLIIVSPCTEGVGPYHQLPALMAQDRHSLEQRIRSGEIAADITGVTAALAVRLNRIGERIRIHLVTGGLSAGVAREMGYIHHASIDTALSDALACQGDSAGVSVMTHGGYTYPMVAGEEGA
jgi:nickel-dependent lactate racemase